MKISLKWLQTYFDTPLPDADAIDAAFTFHAFEVDEREGDMLDLKVLPDRAAYGLCHRGIARELSAILDTPLARDPLRDPLPAFPASAALEVAIEDERKCFRYMGAVVRGVKVGPSPEWLRQALESVGQRSINNVVDATNFVMLDIGQPLHAFDAGKLKVESGKLKVAVRNAKEGETITTLDNRELALDPSMVVIADGASGAPLGIAGIKGGKHAEVTPDTTDILVEAANFDGPTVRRAAQKLKLFTDASLRFQNRPSPELAAYGMRAVLDLIVQVAGSTVEGVVDAYPTPAVRHLAVSVSLARINGLLGSNFSREEVMRVFARLGLAATEENDTFTIMPPFERTDIVIQEDLIEEVGRIIGYEALVPAMPPVPATPPDQSRFRGIEKVKDFLVERGFTEVSTQSFAKKGDIMLANPLDKTHPALRTTLGENMKDAMEKAKQYALRVLAPGQKPKLFEVGTVFTKDGEHIVVETSEPVADIPQVADDNDYTPKRYMLGMFEPFSQYPFMTRDVAFWLNAEQCGTDAEEMLKQLIRTEAGNLLVRLDIFDTFKKEGKVSYAFRLVFESMDRTLTDEEINAIMDRIYTALREKGYEVR